MSMELMWKSWKSLCLVANATQLNILCAKRHQVILLNSFSYVRYLDIQVYFSKSS